MAFQYAYALDGSSTADVKDYALDTLANYKTGAGTNDMKKGDLVFLSAGLVRRATAATATGTTLGVVEGGEFLGLATAGTTYAAANASFTASAVDAVRNPNGVTKVRIDKADIYRVPINQAGAIQTCTNTQVGVTFNIIMDAAGDQKVDLNLSTVPTVKVIDFTKDGKTAFVTLV